MFAECTIQYDTKKGGDICVFVANSGFSFAVDTFLIFLFYFSMYCIFFFQPIFSVFILGRWPDTCMVYLPRRGNYFS